MTRLVGQGAVHLVAGEFAGCAQSGAVELSRLLGLWCAKLAGNMLWRAVWPAVPSFLGQQKGRLNRATLRGCFCPAVGRCRPVPQKGLSFRRRQPTSSGEGGCWGTPALSVLGGRPMGLLNAGSCGWCLRWPAMASRAVHRQVPNVACQPLSYTPTIVGLRYSNSAFERTGRRPVTYHRAIQRRTTP